MLRCLTILSVLLLAGAASAAAAARADLRVNWLTDPPSSLAPGDHFHAAARVTNSGTARAGRSHTTFHLARSVRKPRRWVAVGRLATRRLRPKTSTLRALRVTIPDDLAPGPYFLVVCADADDDVRESAERHNCVGSADYVTVDAAR